MGLIDICYVRVTHLWRLVSRNLRILSHDDTID